MNAIVKLLLFVIVALIVVTLATGCAQNTIYNPDGSKRAVFQGDMEQSDFRIAKDGSVRWTVKKFTPSVSTLAQGKAAEGKVTAAGIAIAASGITKVLAP